MCGWNERYTNEEYDEVVDLLSALTLKDIHEKTKISLSKIKKIKALYVKRNIERIYRHTAFEPQDTYKKIEQFLRDDIFENS